MTKAYVGNVDDPSQVRNADKKVKDREWNEAQDAKSVLQTAGGRRLLWRILTYCRVFESVYDERPNKIAYNSGRQDTGHFITGIIAFAGEEYLLRMMKEAAGLDEVENNDAQNQTETEE